MRRLCLALALSLLPQLASAGGLELLREARKEGVFKRMAEVTWLVAKNPKPGERALLAAFVQERPKRFRIGSFEILERKAFKAVDYGHDLQGSLQGVSASWETFERSERWRAEVKQGSLRFAPAKSRKAFSLKLPKGTLSEPAALFVLPALWEQIPAKLTFPMLRFKRVVQARFDPKPAQVKRPGGSTAEVLTTLQILGTKTRFRVWVSSAKATRGQILALQEGSGAILTRATTQEAEAVMEANERAAKAARAKTKKKPGRDKASNEAAAIGALKSLQVAQALFRERDMDGDGVSNYAPDLTALVKANLIAGPLAKGVARGYRFTLCGAKQAWALVAAPIQPGKTGDRYFATSQAGVSYFSLKPIVLDRKACKLPPGLTPFSRK